MEIEIADEHCVTEAISDTELPPVEPGPPGPSTKNLPNITPAKQAALRRLTEQGHLQEESFLRAQSP